MAEVIYTSHQPDGSSQRPPVRGNATGSPVTVSSGGVQLLGAKVGKATLVAGTKVVADTSITANSIILLTVQSLGTVSTAKPVAVTARSAGASFTITSSDNTDTSVVGYVVIN